MPTKYYSPPGEDSVCFSDVGASIEIAMSYDMGYGMTWDYLEKSEVEALVNFLQDWLNTRRKDG